MSLAAIPKTSEIRPPYRGGPPIKTTFDGGPSDEPDPQIVRITESVMRLVASVGKTPPDRLDTLLRLLQQRKRWVEAELSVERLLNPSPLPPFDSFSLDYILESSSKDELRYAKLLDLLDDCISQVSESIKMLNGGANPSLS